MNPSKRNLPAWVLPFLSGSLLTTLLAAACIAIFVPRLRAPTSTSVRATSLPRDPDNVGKPPRWGILEAVEFPLAASEQMDLSTDVHMLPPKWFFAGASKLQLLRFFMSCDLRERERNALLDRNCWKAMPGGIEVTPPESVVYSLSSVSRERIYSVLSRNKINAAQANPLRLPVWGMEEHLVDRGFTHLEVARLRQLAYTNAAQLCLADLGITKRVLGDAAFDDLLEFLYATPTYQLRLQISRDSDIDALTTYWGKGGREDRIRPLLKSLASVPGGTSVNISYLLPSFARLRLYTFPDSWDDPTRDAQDCAFTALNFFSETPDTNYLNQDYVERVVHNDFTPTHDEPSLGDLVGLVNKDGRVFHMSVYIADEFVFTKNGVSHTEPWVLMRMKDMLTLYYGGQQNAQMVVFRRKDFQPASPAKSPPEQPTYLDWFANAGR